MCRPVLSGGLQDDAVQSWLSPKRPGTGSGPPATVGRPQLKETTTTTRPRIFSAIGILSCAVFCVNDKRRRYASPQEGMKTGANRAILVVPVERYRPVTVWCIEPARECGRDALGDQGLKLPPQSGK